VEKKEINKERERSTEGRWRAGDKITCLLANFQDFVIYWSESDLSFPADLRHVTSFPRTPSENFDPGFALNPLVSVHHKTDDKSSLYFIMNTSYVRQAFRSCTASLSSRTVGRSSRHALVLPGRRVALGVRQYSDDKTPPATEEKSEADAEKIEITPEHELLEKLKAKEAETVDLKVSIFTRRTARVFTCLFLSPESVTVPTSGLPELAT